MKRRWFPAFDVNKTEFIDHIPLSTILKITGLGLNLELEKKMMKKWFLIAFVKKVSQFSQGLKQNNSWHRKYLSCNVIQILGIRSELSRPSWHLLAQNNGNTRTNCKVCSKLTIATPPTSLTSFWCLYFNFKTDFSYFFYVSIVDIEQVHTCWLKS